MYVGNNKAVESTPVTANYYQEFLRCVTDFFIWKLRRSNLAFCLRAIDLSRELIPSTVLILTK